MVEQPAYGLVFELLPTATATQRGLGRLITLHATEAAAVQYYERERDTLLRQYSDPSVPARGTRGLLLHVVTEESCFGTAHRLPEVHAMIAAAQAEGKPCFEARHDSTAARPELHGNEINKLVMQSQLTFAPVSAERPRTRRALQRVPK